MLLFIEKLEKVLFYVSGYGYLFFILHDDGAGGFVPEDTIEIDDVGTVYLKKGVTIDQVPESADIGRAGVLASGGYNLGAFVYAFEV